MGSRGKNTSNPKPIGRRNNFTELFKNSTCVKTCNGRIPFNSRRHWNSTMHLSNRVTNKISCAVEVSENMAALAVLQI